MKFLFLICLLIGLASCSSDGKKDGDLNHAPDVAASPHEPDGGMVDASAPIDASQQAGQAAPEASQVPGAPAGAGNGVSPSPSPTPSLAPRAAGSGARAGVAGSPSPVPSPLKNPNDVLPADQLNRKRGIRK